MGFLGGMPPNMQQFLKTLAQQAQQTSQTARQPNAAMFMQASPMVMPQKASFRTHEATLLNSLMLAQLMALESGVQPQEWHTFFKKLLALPKEFNQLLLQLAQDPKEQTAQKLLQLIQEQPDLQLSLKQLQTVLSEKLGQANGKLIQLMQSNQLSFTQDAGGMRELIQWTTALSQQVSQSPTEALNTTMLLFLPWYPLVLGQELRLGWGAPEEGEGGADGFGAPLMLFITTRSLGQLKLRLMETAARELDILIDHQVIFTEKQPELTAAVQEYCDALGLKPPKLEFSPQRTATFQTHAAASSTLKLSTPASPTPEQDLAVFPTEHVPVTVTSVGYWMAKTIFELDNQAVLKGRRSKTVQRVIKPGPSVE